VPYLATLSHPALPNVKSNSARAVWAAGLHRKLSRKNTLKDSKTIGTAPFCETKLPAPRIVPLGQSMIIQLRGALTLSTDGSGNIKSYLVADPSSTTSTSFGTATQFGEWSALTSFFAQVRIKQFEVYLAPTYHDETKGDDFPSMYISGSLVPNISAPTTANQVADNGDSQLWNPFTDKSGRTRYHAVRQPSKNLAWASVSTPSPGFSGGVASGCPGAILFWMTGGPISVAIATVLVVGTYQLRSRT
jgi:hypothetical protein